MENFNDSWFFRQVGGIVFYAARPRLLLSILLIGLLGFWSDKMSAQTFESKNFQLELITDGVYAAIHSLDGYAISNAGIIDLGNKTLIFDTFLSPEAAKDLLRAVEMLSLSPVAYVVNSHYHNDHIRGNQVFTPNVNIISTAQIRNAIAKYEPNQIEMEKGYAPERLAELQAAFKAEKDMQKRQEMSMWLGYYQAMIESHPQLITILPNVTFEDKLIIHGARRKVELITFGRGHTECDLILYLPEEEIMFTGDLVFINMHPYLADGYPEDWITSLNRIRDLNVRSLVPGHGRVGNADDISMMVQYIEAIDSLAQTMIKIGNSVDDLPAQPIPAPFSSWWFPDFFRMNLQFMFESALAKSN